MTLGSLFAGIGGFDLGFERAGFETVWQVEIDPFCRRVLERHFPDAHRFPDIRECCGGILREDLDSLRTPNRCVECGRLHFLQWVDVIAGGFPCQDISVIGKAEGIEGEHSGLWSEMCRIICELRPRFAVMENVAALTFRGIDKVLGDLAQIGFDAEWHCVPAAYAGLPHIRDRIWIIAYPAAQRMGSGKGNETIGNEATFTMPTQCNRIPDWKNVLSELRGMDDGLSGRIHRDRGKALGNAVVPQIAQWIAERIKAVLSNPPEGQKEKP